MFIEHNIDGIVIPQRAKEGYINATAMCQAAGKLFGHYNTLQTTREFLVELEADIGIPISKLIQVVKGGKPEMQGTWIHPKVAIHLAQWLSPKIAVKVTNWIHDWMTKGSPAPIQLNLSPSWTSHRKPISSHVHGYSAKCCSGGRYPCLWPLLALVNPC
ncbi:MAG: KilA-N domain-containing protein [Magnetococcales bacterium]|nr:KilA-N domain-containing protein [Magnetococcales bacterium]